MEFCKAPRAVYCKVFPCFYNFWPPFGTRPESKVGQKSICGRTTPPSWRSFTVFYDLFRLAHVLDSILVRFLMKFQCFFSSLISRAAHFFSTWRPSRNTAIYISGATFSFLVFRFFASKNAWNSMSKLNPEKTCQNNPGRDPKWTKMLKKSSLDMPEICKIVPKSSFWRAWFFGEFWRAKKNKKIRQKRLGRRKIWSARRNVKAAWEDYRRVLERLQGRKQQAGVSEKEEASSTPTPVGRRIASRIPPGHINWLLDC